MLNISIKSKLVYYIIFKFCSIINLQGCQNIMGCNIFCECTQYIFLIVQWTIHPYLVKWYTIVKAIWIHMTLHVLIMPNLLVRNVIMKVKSSSVFFIFIFLPYFSYLSMITMSHWTLYNYLRFTLVFFWEPLTNII